MTPCNRRRYRDELAAKLALAQIRRRDSAKRITREETPYPCRLCGGWHLGVRERSRV